MARPILAIASGRIILPVSTASARRKSLDSKNLPGRGTRGMEILPFRCRPRALTRRFACDFEQALNMAPRWPCPPRHSDLLAQRGGHESRGVGEMPWSASWRWQGLHKLALPVRLRPGRRDGLPSGAVGRGCPSALVWTFDPACCPLRTASPAIPSSGPDRLL